MSEKLTVAITAEIEDLKKRLVEAQDRLAKFAGDTQTSINNITLDVLENDLRALNTELRNTAIGSVKFKELGDQIVATETKINNAFQSISKTGAKSFNGLNNSINQITRELPAFALSANIGFLAISNNLPILIDEINRLKVANQQLVASGKPTESVFKAITSSIFSLQTGLSIGVTLLTLYGGKLVELANKALSGKDAFDENKIALDALNNAYADKSVSKKISEIVLLADTFKKSRGNIDLERDALKKYNDVIKDSSLHKKTFAEADKEFISNTKAYINSVIQRAAADKLAIQAADSMIEVIKEQQNIDNRTAELEKNKARLSQLSYDEIAAGVNKTILIRQQELKYAISQSQQIVNTKQKEVDSINKIISGLDFRTTEDIIKIDNNRGLDGLEQMLGASQLKKEAEDLFKLYKESPQILKLLGDAYASNPFFRDLINGDIKAETDKLQTSLQKFLNTKRDDTSGGGMPIDKEIEATTENIQNLVNILGTSLTSAFDAALISGQNFGQVLAKAIGDLIKKLIAALAVAASLTALLSIFGGDKALVAVGGFAGIFKGLTGFNFGGGGASSEKVSTAVATSSNSGSVAFEIRGDKLYGVLQNYQGRLDRLT